MGSETLRLKTTYELNSGFINHQIILDNRFCYLNKNIRRLAYDLCIISKGVDDHSLVQREQIIRADVEGHSCDDLISCEHNLW